MAVEIKAPAVRTPPASRRPSWDEDQIAYAKAVLNSVKAQRRETAKLADKLKEDEYIVAAMKVLSTYDQQIMELELQLIERMPMVVYSEVVDESDPVGEPEATPEPEQPLPLPVLDESMIPVAFSDLSSRMTG
jgi:hypothetical protein